MLANVFVFVDLDVDEEDRRWRDRVASSVVWSNDGERGRQSKPFEK